MNADGTVTPISKSTSEIGGENTLIEDKAKSGEYNQDNRAQSVKIIEPGKWGAYLAKAEIQLKKVDGADVLVRTYWAGRSGQTQAPLSDVLENPKCLERGIKGPMPSRFEVAMVRDLAGRFSGRRTFVDDVEAAVPEYYDRVGQHVRAWTPPPPPIEKQDPIGTGVDGSPIEAAGLDPAQNDAT